MSEQTTLWCVNIHGPDDVIAQPDYLSAIKAANAFNAFWQKLKEERGHHEYHPRMWATPVEWRWSDKEHAESLVEAAKPTAEYAWLTAPDKPESPPQSSFGSGRHVRTEHA